MSGSRQRSGMGVFLESGSPASSPPELRYSGWHRMTLAWYSIFYAENSLPEKILFSGVWYSGEPWFASLLPLSFMSFSSALPRQCLPMILLFQHLRGRSPFNTNISKFSFLGPFWFIVSPLDLFLGSQFNGNTVPIWPLFNFFSGQCHHPIQATSCGCCIWPGCCCSHLSLHTSVRRSGG